MRWLEMDATRMEAFHDCSFDLVLDKGVLDTFTCIANALITVARYLKEIVRVLRPGGTYLCISYAEPSRRVHFLQMPQLHFSLRQIEIPAIQAAAHPHYAYICRTRKTGDDCTHEKWS